jgi:hypothetical protein
MNFKEYLFEALLKEARMTRSQLDDEATELLGVPGEPSGIVSGKGYNRRRVRKEFRRAEKRGLDTVTDQDVQNMSATGISGSLGSRKGFFGKLGARLGLRARAKKHEKNRGYLQNIGAMEKQMKKDPDAFAPPTRITPDPRNPNHQKYTQIGGRTRQTISRLVRGKPLDMLTIPSQRYAGSAERYKKWVASGGKKRVEKQLARKNKYLRGQDPRLS